MFSQHLECSIAVRHRQVSPLNPIRDVLLCYVTDGKALHASPEETVKLLLAKIAATANAGVDWIQIREKELSARALATLAEEAMRGVPATCRILINDRLDVACAAGAGGVHLGERSMAVGDARRLVGEKKITARFLVGASAHSLEAAVAAERAGADYVIFGPVFATPSKAVYGPAQGVGRLAEICRSVSIPVLAIGGITLENARQCAAAGARGIAAIRLFQEVENVAQVVRELRKNLAI